MKDQMTITSAAFQNEGRIPAVYTCEGDGINPPLDIKHIPHETQSLALIMEDPDAPNGTFDHWVVWNIPNKQFIEEGTNPGINGLNSGGKTGYYPPCPPSGEHRYFFYLFALDTMLDITPGSDKETLLEAMENHILGKAGLMGRFQKKM